MINFREIFNPEYSFIFVILILILTVMIFILHKNTKESIHILGKFVLISGVITLLIAIVLELGINTFIPYNYKIFVQVISKNLSVNLLYNAIENIIIGLGLLLLSKILFYNKSLVKS